MRVGDQRHAPAALPPVKTRYPLYRRLGGPQGRSGHVQKISPPTRIRSPDRPARSESLYRLSYAESSASCKNDNNDPVSTFRSNLAPSSSSFQRHLSLGNLKFKATRFLETSEVAYLATSFHIQNTGFLNYTALHNLRTLQ